MGSTKRAWMRRLGVACAGVVAIVLVAYLVLIVAFRAVVDPASLADRAEPHVSAALNRRVSIGSARLSVFPRPEVSLLRLRIENLPDFEGSPLATVDELRLRPRLLPLLRRNVRIDRILVVGPRVLLQVDDQGRSNFGDFVPASREDTEGPTTPLSFEVRGIALQGGRIGFRDAVSGRSLQADGLALEGSIARDEEGRLALDLESNVDSLRFAYPPGWRRGARGLRVRTRIQAVAGPGLEWIDIRDGSATINGLTVDIGGRADSLKSARRLVDLVVRGDGVDLSRLVSTLPDSIRQTLSMDVWGDLGIDLRVHGTLGPDEVPDVDGLLTLRRGGIRRGGERPLLEALDADVAIAGRRAEITGLRAVLPGGDMSGTAQLALDTTLAFHLAIQGRADAARLAAALRLTGTDGPSLSRGTARWNVTADGTAATPAATRLAGDVGTENLEIGGGRLEHPIEVPSATFVLEGTRARWDEVAVRSPEGQLRTSGVISDLLGSLAGEPRRPVVEASLTGPRLDLDALLGPGAVEIGYGRLAWARLGDRLLRGRPPEEWAAERELRRPGPLPVIGGVTFQMDSVIRLPYRLAAVEGRLVLEPNRVGLTDTRFEAYGGQGSLRGSLHLGDVSSEPFQLEVSLQDVRAEQYLAQNSPLGDLISGSLTLDLALEGGLDSLALPLTRALNGAGRFEMRDGRIAPNALTDGVLDLLRLEGVRDLRFTRWSSPILVRQGSIVLDGSRFSGSELVAEMRGALGFGGSVDLGALVKPDSALARAATTAAGAAGAVIDRYMRAGGAVELALRLTGQASDPKVELDPNAMQESSRSVLEETGQRAREAGEAEVKERGLDLLRGLTGQKTEPDTTDAAVSDSVPGPPGQI